MYFKKYQPLKNKLKNRSLSDRDALPYFVVFCALYALTASFPLIEEMNKWDYLSGILTLVLTIAGIYYVYIQNGASDGYDLILKYIVLGWIVLIRCLFVFIPVMIILSMVNFADADEVSTNWFDCALIFVFEIIYYERLGRHIRDTNKFTSEQFAGEGRL